MLCQVWIAGHDRWTRGQERTSVGVDRKLSQYQGRCTDFGIAAYMLHNVTLPLLLRNEL